MAENWIVIPVRNNSHLTKKAVATFRAQDIEGGVNILILENASTDGTAQWLASQPDICRMHFDPPKSVAESWNHGLRFVFDQRHEDYCAVINNDVELRPDCLRHLVNDGGLFVTAVGTRDPEKIKPPYADPDPEKKRPHPDFSCYLIRREAWEKVGPFDENFKIAFCEDGDYDLRLYKAGIRATCIDLPFLHHGSMTIKNAEPKEMKRIQVQADLNRKYFEKKWGFPMASEAYYRALDKGGPPPE
jgi:GT2 family glycosyltransferase